MIVSMSKLIRLSLLIFVCEFSQIICQKQKPNYKGLRLRMIHSNSPDSPTYQPKLTDLDRTKNLLAMSESRMRYLANNDTSREGVSNYHNPDMAPQMRKLGYASYYVTLGLGQFSDINNPYQNIYLLFDTGSDYTWTQCEGCRRCFYQNSPYYPRTRSQTYKPYPCSRCPGGQCSQGQDHCTIFNTYADGAWMGGILATETFTFSSQSLFDEVIHGILFACTIETVNFREANVDNNPITGVLGMGQGVYSLISQLGRKVREYRFSYCLQDSNDQALPYSQMLLSFGEEIGRTPIMSVTPILKNPKHPIYYYVDLIDVSVNKIRLKIPRKYFMIQNDNSGGTIFNSGTSLSFIVSNAFDIIKSAVDAYVVLKNPYLRRNTNPNDFGLELCWEPRFNSPTVSFPTITFHFGNEADMVVQPNQLISPVPSPGSPKPGLYCMFLSRATDDLNIIGAFQQVNQRVITDVQTMQLSFASEDCSHSTW